MTPLQYRRYCRPSFTVVTAVLLGIAASSCGPLSGSASQENVCNSPGISDGEIKLGLLFPNTGALQGSGTTVRSAVGARIQEANQAGGVHGRTVSYEWRDDGTDVEHNELAARDLVENENVFGIVEMTNASAGSAEYLGQHGVPVSGVGEAVWADHANMFTHTYFDSDGPSVDTFGSYVKAQGGTRAGVIRSDVVESAKVDAKLVASLTAVGVEVVPEPFVYNPVATDMARLAAEIGSAGVDTLVGTVPADSIATVLDALRVVGVDLKVILSTTGYDQQVLAQFGNRIAGLSVYLPYIPFEVNTEAHQRYHDSMTRYAPEVRFPDQEFTISAYIATDLLLHGLELAGNCPTREMFVEKLRASKGYDARGLLPAEIDFAEDFGKIGTCYTFVRVNATGSGYDIVPNLEGTGSSQWCGNRLS